MKIAATIATQLLQWYAENGRELPWRQKGGAHPDPYVVLVSEFMLQQTTVKTVIPYFLQFMKRFPTVKALAESSEEEVYRLWQGLGYYNRAHSLHLAAQSIIHDFNGRFPDSPEEVKKLKGIGAYMTASFLTFAFNQAEPVVDGNVSRVIARLYHLTGPLNEIKSEIRQKAESLTSRKHPADYASAIMDLGAMICTPKNPQCIICPLQKHCLSAAMPDVEQIPLRLKSSQKEKRGKVFIITNHQGYIFIRKRTEKGLLHGLYEFPWNTENSFFAQAENTGKSVAHTFSHFKLILDICTLSAGKAPSNEGFFAAPEKLADYPMSTLMKKVLNKIKAES